MSQDEQRRVIYQDRAIAFRIVRSRRKSLGLCLDPEEGLVARVPLRVSDAEVDALVLRKAAWVLGHLERLASLGLPPPPRRYQDGELFSYLGREHALEIAAGRRGGRVRVEAAEGRLLVSLGQDLAETVRALAVARAVALWYRAQAARLLPPRVAKFCAELGLAPAAVRVREQKRRWGSCSSLGGINLNWRLVMAPWELIDYVAAHEVCHLMVPDHSPRFWRLVESLMPDCRQRRKRLNEVGAHYRL